MESKKILVTGSAGFIGFHLSKQLCQNGFQVYGLDNLNNYYDVGLKLARLDDLKCFATQRDQKDTKVSQHDKYQNIRLFKFEKIDLFEREKIFELFEKEEFDYVIHLAAQAGVRYSIENPYAYIESNIVGFMNILEACRHFPVKHLIFASSSSVYGSNKKVPFSESDNVDHPISLYAATKKSNELMAHTYSNLYGIPATGLRFFTVYGTWGRPDMAYFSFTKNIIKGKPINVFNNGNLERDFTYIDDIVEGILRLIEKIPQKNEKWDKIKSDPSTSFAPYRIYNIGNNKPVKLLHFIEVLESVIGKKAKKNFLPMQPGDVEITFADIEHISKAISFQPNTTIENGLKKFVEWYINYYKIS